jgi:hypothetical protein
MWINNPILYILFIFYYSNISAQEIMFKKPNGVLISSVLSDEEWTKVKHNYVPDSLSYNNLVIAEYIHEELIKINENVFTKKLIKKGIDFSEAYSLKLMGNDDIYVKKLLNSINPGIIKRITKGYKGNFKVKKNS